MSGSGTGVLFTALKTSDKGGRGVVKMRWGSRESSQSRVWGKLGDMGEGNREGGAWESGKRAGGIWNRTAH